MVLTIILTVLAAGICTPILMKVILRKQKSWKIKLIKDNGRLDIIDEICAMKHCCPVKVPDDYYKV